MNKSVYIRLKTYCCILPELSKAGVCEERHVAEQLVAAVRLRRVEGVTAVADVLRTVEHAEGQPCQEVPRGEVARNRPHLP